MSDLEMSDVEQQLTDHLRRQAAAATPRFDLEGIEDRGGDRTAVELTRVRHGQRPSLWVAVAAALVLVVLVGALVLLDNESTVDVGPAGPPEVPSWPALVRAPSNVVHTVAEEDGEWEDPLDASEGWADITGASYGKTNQGSWGISLAAQPPRFDGLDPGVVVSYGVVVDTNADGSPDYVAGISSDAPQPGNERAWLTNLATGKTYETVKGPYGFPIEFSMLGSRVGLTFLPGSLVDGLNPDTVRSYVWTSATRDGVVFAHDYAPDTGWFSPQPVDPANPADPTVEELVLPDPGEQPADAAAAEAQVRLAFTGIFDSSSTRETRSHFSERPAVWIAANQQLTEGEYAEFVDGMSAVVDEVVFTDPTHAAVRFGLYRAKGSIPQPADLGKAVLVDGRWLVAIDTTCALVKTANVQCDMGL